MLMCCALQISAQPPPKMSAADRGRGGHAAWLDVKTSKPITSQAEDYMIDVNGRKDAYYGTRGVIRSHMYVY